jgi:hypothetical protein
MTLAVGLLAPGTGGSGVSRRRHFDAGARHQDSRIRGVHPAIDQGFGEFTNSTHD